MRLILLLSLIIYLQPLIAQNYSNEKLFGSWKLQTVDAKKLMSGISMYLKVEPETMIISNDFGYAMLGTDPTGYKIIKTDVFGKIKP